MGKLATPLDFRYFFSVGRLVLPSMKPEQLAMPFAIFIDIPLNLVQYFGYR